MSSTSSLMGTSSPTIFLPPLLLFFSIGTLASDPFALSPDKQIHLHFFFHDIVSGPNPTAIRIAAAPTTKTSSTGFGAMVMIDDPLTDGVDAGSKLVGRAQGVYATASMEDPAVLMMINLVIVDGEFKGSSLAVLGRNAVFSGQRELPVVGGTGKFRWAEGYALINTRKYDSNTGDATVEYDVYLTQRCDSSTGCDSTIGSGGAPHHLKVDFAFMLIVVMITVVVLFI